MKYFKVILLYLMVAGINNSSAQDEKLRRQAYLDDSNLLNIEQRIQKNTRRISVQDSLWVDWQKRTGELPPDFSKMPSYPMLPEPLIFNEGGKERPVLTKKDWEERRNQIKKDYQYYITGHFPAAPKNLIAEVLNDKVEGGVRIQQIRLKFGPGHEAVMNLELMIPQNTGQQPVYMTQWTHRGWAQLAVKRGYIACVYAAADTKDDTEAYQALYPEFDFTLLMRRAWGASRVVDYLLTRREVRKDQIAISGHSRNGKQSLWAAAYDERIAAVISNSSSTGGDGPWRFGDPQYVSETLDYVTALNGQWFHPRLRFFFGREDKLPVDQNLLGALIAPRALLYHYSIVERGLNPWANEQNYYSVKKVYDFFKVPAHVGVLTRMGEHAVAARDVEKTIDFLDIHFKRRNITWENELYFKYDYSKWLKDNPKEQNAKSRPAMVKLKDKYKNLKSFEVEKKQINNNLIWLLGNEPPGVKAAKADISEVSRYDWIDLVLRRPEVKGAKMMYYGPYTAMGDHLPGILYCPVDKSGNVKYQTNGKVPVIIYLHQYAHATGYARGYSKTGGIATKKLFEEMIAKGFAVLAIDMFGFGARIAEATNFYDRFPEWSKMGKMVTDVKGCVDALEGIDFVDHKNIYVLGNTIGGSVGLMATALDRRIAGAAVVAAFSPWRSANQQYESLRNYSHLHGFIPRLGAYAQQPGNVPVDFGEIIAAAAPKPLLIIAPELDRHADLKAVKNTLQSVSAVYELHGKKEQLVVKYPHEFNRMTEEMYREVSQFFVDCINQTK